VRLFAGLHLIDETVNTNELRDDLTRLIHFYYMPVGQLSVSRLLQDLIAVVRQYRIELPSDLALTLKVLMTLEGLLKRLDPELNVLDVARPFAARVRMGRFADWLNRDAAADFVEDTGRLARSLPWQTQEILERARTGRLKLRIDFEDLDQRVREIDRSINRLAFSVVIAGVFVGSSLIIRAGLGPSYLGLPLLGLGGFAVAGVLGIWFLVGTMRSGRL
jgi:ubiquinone biosynthesis protein